MSGYGHGPQRQIGAGTAAQQRSVKHGVSRLLPYAPPWAIWLAVLGVCLLGEALWGQHPLYPLGLMLSHQGAMWVVWKLAKSLNDVLKVLALATIAASMIFMILVGVLGPTAVLLSMWGFIGFSLCCYWNIRVALTKQLSEQATGSAAGGPVSKLLGVLNGGQASNPQVLEGGQVVQQLEANRGEQKIDELWEYVRAVEQMAGMRPGAGRLEPDPDDSGRAKAVWIPEDQLRGMVKWEGPSAFGESIFAPIPVGKYADMMSARIWLTGDDDLGRALTMWLIMGMTGAGKSQAWVMAMADALTRRDFVLWAHDSEKGLQTLAPLIRGGGIDWVTMDVPKGKKMFAAVKRVVKARARAFGAKGLKQWEPDCGFPVLAVWVEEAASLGQLKAFLEIARAARSVGMVLMLSMQRASHTTLDTDTRAQLGGNVCLGVESAQDSKFALPDATLDLGAEPERWRATKPGYAYIAAPGIDEQRSAVELRFFKADDEQIEKAVRDGAAVRTGLHAIDIEAAGADYANRIPTEHYVPRHPEFEKAIGMDLSSVIGDDDGMRGPDSDSGDAGNGAVGDRQMGRSHVDDETESREAELDAIDDQRDEETEEETAARVTMIPDLPACPDAVISHAPVTHKRLSGAQCQALIQKYLSDCVSRGQLTITAPELHKMKPPIPRGKEWLRTELKRLCDDVPDGHEGYTLERDDDAPAGEYVIVPPA